MHTTRARLGFTALLLIAAALSTTTQAYAQDAGAPPATGAPTAPMPATAAPVTAAPTETLPAAPAAEATPGPDASASTADVATVDAEVATTVALPTPAPEARSASAASNEPTGVHEHGAVMVRLQLEPGALLARQHGPLTMGLEAVALAGSLAVGINVSRGTAIGVEAWYALSGMPSMQITAPAFDGAGDTVNVNGASLSAWMLGAHLTHLLEPQHFALSVTAGLAGASFDYDDYDFMKLPYNRTLEPDGTTGRSPIGLDKTNLGIGFGFGLSKVFPLGGGLGLGIGAHFRHLIVPDDEVYTEDDSRGPLRYRAATWYITSFGLDASLVYF